MRSKLIAAGVGAVGYGLLVGWAVTADYYEQKMKSNQQTLGDIIEKKSKEVDEARRILLLGKAQNGTETLREKLDSVEEQANAGVETSDEKIERMRAEAGPQANEEFDDPDAIPEGETEDETRSKLQSVIDQYTADGEQAEVFVETATAMTTDRTPPFVISRMKYAWDEEEGDEYEKITLTYYPRDRILLDDEDDVIEDVANTVGWQNLSRFGDESDDGDVVFVRNRRLRSDFEVVRDTENQPPAHVRFAMSRDEFETNRAAGLIRFRDGDK